MRVLFEDNHLLVVEKPARVPVQGDRTGDESLLDQAKSYLKEKYAKAGNVYLGLVHRLDRPVSGIVVFAKTSKAAGRLSAQFREGKVHKRYRALVSGTSIPEGAVLEHYLGPAPQNKTAVSEREVKGFKFARLQFRKLTTNHPRFPDCSFLEIALDTGRKHQIRAQLSFFGHPIVGDRKYGSRIPLKEGRIALVANELEILHPITGDPLHVEIPLDPHWPLLGNLKSDGDA